MTPWTTDLHKVARDTDAIFPDWNQRVDRIRGGEDWAVFEWTGTATFHPGEGKAGIPISMTGATVIDVDADGKVTAWRDYLDTNEPTQQIQAGPRARPWKAAEPATAGRQGWGSGLARHRLHVGHAGVVGLVEILGRLLVARPSRRRCRCRPSR